MGDSETIRLLGRLGEGDSAAADELLPLLYRELRSIAGLTLEETAEQVGKTVRQVHLAWGFARGWLRRELTREAS